MMNKGLRNQMQQQKFKKRLNKFGFKMKNPTDWKCYRTTSTPCSCAMCSPGKVLQNGVKKKAYKEYLFYTTDL